VEDSGNVQVAFYRSTIDLPQYVTTTNAGAIPGSAGLNQYGLYSFTVLNPGDTIFGRHPFPLLLHIETAQDQDGYSQQDRCDRLKCENSARHAIKTDTPPIPVQCKLNSKK
jgi:hypothetical protein